MDEKKYKLICVRKGKTNYARTNNRKNVTLGSYITYLMWMGSSTHEQHLKGFLKVSIICDIVSLDCLNPFKTANTF